MNPQSKIDNLHKNRLKSIAASYLALMESISISELEANRKLKSELRRIRRQFELIAELNESFEHP